MESSKEEETKTFCYQEATAMMDADKYISRDFYNQYQIKRIMIVQRWSSSGPDEGFLLEFMVEL